MNWPAFVVAHVQGLALLAVIQCYLDCHAREQSRTFPHSALKRS